MRHHSTFIILLLLLAGAGRTQAGITDSLWTVWNSSRADSLRFDALGRLSWALMFEQPDSALTVAQLLYERAGEKEDRRAQAMALTYQGIAYTTLGNQFAARQSYLEMHELYTLVGDRRGVAGACLNLGALHHGQGERAKAVDWYAKGVVIFEELGDKRGMASAYNNLSGLYNELGDTTSAMAYARRCVAINEELGDMRAIAGIKGNMGLMRMEAGDLAAAMMLLRGSLSTRRAIGDPSGEAHVLHDIGEAHRRSGALDSARWYFERSIAMRERLKDEPGLVLTRTSLGYLALGLAHHEEAAALCGEAGAVARDLGLMPLERKACDCLYKAVKALGREKEALAAFERYSALGDSIEQGDSEKRLRQMEFARQVVQDSLARAEKERLVQADKERSAARRPFILGGGGLAVIIAVLAARRRRRRRAEQGG